MHQCSIGVLRAKLRAAHERCRALQSAIRNPKSKPVRLQPPANEALAAFLARRWGAPIRITRMIAEGARGNVRAAMGDLELWMG